MSIEKLDFKKVTKENLPYTLILTKVIQNIKNALAGYIWIYLASLPPDWIVNKEHIKNHFEIGDRKIREIFSYLKRSNLIEYHQVRLASGAMGELSIHILCGDQFNENEPYKNTGGAKSACAVITGGSKAARAVNRPCGSGALQKKQNTKAIKNKKNIKSFLDKKPVDNSPCHSFAVSMDQMASEKKHIDEHEARKKEEKSTPMPKELKQLIKGMTNLAKTH